MIHRGWLLDPHLDGGYANLWFKTEGGGPLMVRDKYRPHLLAEPREGIELEELRAALEAHPYIHSVKDVDRYTDLRRDAPKRLIEVRADSADSFRRVEEYTRGLRQVREVYDAGLAPIQWYMIERGVAPSSLCEFEEAEGVLKTIRALDDGDAVAPPPFKVLTLQAPEDGEVDAIKLQLEGAETQTITGNEKDVLQTLNEALTREDPDVLVTDNAAYTVKRLLRHAQANGVTLNLGRGNPRRGRVILGLYSYLDMGLAGLVERARFTLAPMGLSSDWEAGKTIDSRQCYEAHRLCVGVPDMKGGVAYESDAWDMVRKDRGGMLFSPQPGLHENVGCLDFESMFPNLIVRRNISYETVTDECVDTTRQGFMGGFTREFLERRLKFKHLRSGYPRNTQEWGWCEQRQNSLKLMLVVVYGYSGCYANRFANVRVFQEINRQARRTLVRAMNIASDRGYEVVYGDTDSLFVKKLNATKRDYEDLAAEIAADVNLPIKLDKYFRFLVLLHKRQDSQQAATRRYYGRLTDGTLFCRGIEARKHDTPPYIKAMQERTMYALLDASDSEDVLRHGLPRARSVVNKALGEIKMHRIETRELVISKRLRRELSEYRSLQAHVISAMVEGVEEGDSRFVYVASTRSNPFTRVTPASLLDENARSYDWRRYVALAKRAASNILEPFTPEYDQDGSELKMTQLTMYT
jgi:DNA polymerase elongation subunit (family B)